jgi:neurofibromin 1
VRSSGCPTRGQRAYAKNGRRIFYFIVSRVGLLDYDLLAYHVFTVGWIRRRRNRADRQVLDKITDFFDVVIDLTDFSSSAELPLSWLKRSVQMCPPSVLPCVNVSYPVA